MDQVSAVTDPLIQFARASVHFFHRCTKPDRKEFKKNAIATAVGFLAMGILGFIIKLVFVPLNSIIVGG
ncbi:Protein transport protein Sec61 subunit gamma [Echinococcus granulosus]|uniref:Protein transport protein Sec61 subunit n=2 Tax=Echinococcus TaxID=6209 RepID=U6JF36_ECHGR|nr:Protein transport protein Sec61 subunit gamma [Echinococcus granulosus]EUB61677.1 Protein transport protein Sec61 subunit gamma [Echinococcus granulosus]KAH9287424.1 Protein transport protein Sec61 subunit gamma [Echinococcus granulosus]CDS22669.1 protein transport protein Sec61 subunit [Echinococcus granulosus]CDS35875.1 protein transport protein Sec61 subunit [Echinococcus multilocularis]